MSDPSAENQPRQQLDQILPDVYDDLRRLAANELNRERRGHTIQTTALVHEAYLRLVGQRHVDWQDAQAIRRAAVICMRRILVDYARQRNARKRQVEGVRISLSGVTQASNDPDLLALNEALDELEQLDPRQAAIVELRYFGGMTLQETADNCGISLATVKREWVTARAWLYRRLQGT
ncbi:MAG: sigma-70 family RNA polymerase sigma factor [Planctomycetales bacterium]|nr:sigma-70 family RNA polymerase sigma factor [Planctomycetales bacterium]